MRFCSLGSGSQGNALLVQASLGPEAEPVSFLVDCGLGLKEVEERMLSRGTSPDQLSFIVVTHEHGDHIGGVSRLAKAYGLPVLATHGTLAAANGFDEGIRLVELQPSQPLHILGLLLQPIPVPHDAREPICLRIEDSLHRLAVVTDLGHVTPHLIASLQNLDALFLEFNYDQAMLDNGPYPPSLKSRVGGDYGHLSNEASADLLRKVLGTELQVVIAAHLSQKNNHPDCVMRAVADIDWGATHFECATQDNGVDWVTLK